MRGKGNNVDLVSLELQGKLLILSAITFGIIDILLNNYIVNKIGITYYLIYMLVSGFSILVIVIGLLIHLLPFLKEGKLFRKTQMLKVQVGQRLKNASWATFILGFSAFYINMIILGITLLVKLSQILI